MPICYICRFELTEANKSKEHIILNALGGKLKSSDLLCKGCNNKLGNTADAVLAKQFALIAALLDISRERNDIPIIKGGKLKDGTEVHLENGNTPRLAKPKLESKVIDGGVEYKVVARDEKEMHQLLSSIKKKHAHFDIEKAMESAKSNHSRLKEPVTYQQIFGGIDAFRSIAKTAINFYIYKKGNPNTIKDLIPFIQGTSDLDIVKHYHPDKSIYKKEPHEVIHLIHLVGKKYDRVLYCYIEFFSTHSYLVKLSMDYDGPNISHTYGYDLLNNKLVTKEVKLKLNRDFLISLKTSFNDFPIVQEKGTRLMKIAHQRQLKKEQSRIIENASNEIFATKYKSEKIITEKMMNEFIKKVSNDVVNLWYGGREQTFDDLIESDL